MLDEFNKGLASAKKKMTLITFGYLIIALFFQMMAGITPSTFGLLHIVVVFILISIGVRHKESD